MTRPTMSSRFAADVEQALESLPRASSSLPAFAPHRTRTAVVTAVVAVVLLVVAALAIVAPSRRSAPAGPTAEPRTAGVASCDAAGVAPLTCDSYVLQRPEDGSNGFEVWVDVLDGTPRLVVGESERIRVLPLRLTADGATRPPVAAWPTLQRVCFPGSDCALDQAVEKVFSRGAGVTLAKGELRVISGGSTLVARSTGEPHRYARLGRVLVAGRTLLTRHDDGVHLDAANGGRLSVNAAGCLTDGDFVLVLPDTTVLHEDGSIDIGGRHVPLGGRLHLGGGEGSVPADQRCGTGGYWYGWGA